MATIMIYEPNEIIAQKLCDSLKKEKYNAIRCDENVIPSCHYLMEMVLNKQMLGLNQVHH